MAFFEQPSEHSLVKAEIVSAYFAAWANIMALKQDSIAYMDLYAGPGRYDDGQDSTPMLVLREAIKSPRLQRSLVALFNDANPSYAAQLQQNIDALDGIGLLRHKPQVTDEEVGPRVARMLGATRMVPTLTFLDPWGYVGLSRDLIAGALKDFGSEVIFFFNYSRFTGAVAIPSVEPHMSSFFSPERLARMRPALEELKSVKREGFLMRQVGETLQELGAKHLIPFRFMREGGKNLHYIVFVTKHPLGYEKMKDVMWSKGIKDEDEVPQFEYVPQREGRQLSFDVDRPIRRLRQDLLRQFRGQRLQFQTLFDAHQVDTPFVRRNYRTVLNELADEGVITIEDRRKGSLAPTKWIRFPS